MIDPMLEFLTETDKKLIELESRIRVKYLALHPELRNFHVSLGPNALNKSDDEILAELDAVDVSVNAQKQVWNSKTEAEKLLEYLETTYSLLLDIMDECKFDLREMSTWNSADSMLKSKLHSMIEMELLPMNNTETFDKRKLYRDRNKI